MFLDELTASPHARLEPWQSACVTMCGLSATNLQGAGAGCRVQGAGCGVQGAGCRVQCRVKGAGCRVGRLRRDVRVERHELDLIWFGVLVLGFRV